MKNAKYSLLPHCAGDTQTWLVKSIIATIPKLVGLKMCFRHRWRTNLLTIVSAAVRNTRARLLVRSNRQSERPEISGLRGSKKGRQIFGCRRRELARLFPTRRRFVAIRYRTRASQRRRSARKKERQSGNSAGRFGESSKTSLGLVSSAF